ncbi:MAG: acetamidase/formamidase family protein [Anaerolineaceae bacterium]|nr:acetamidase/formamidase family protein [Anaerolineaceae bacterium]
MIKYEPLTYHSHYRKCEPIIPIEEGQLVQTTTLDAHGGSPEGVRSKGFSNPLTGPFVLPQALPGDSLTVEIHSIRPLGNSGFSYAYPRPWLMDAADAALFPNKESVKWSLESDAGFTATTLPNGKQIKLAMQPMLGCVGLACDPEQTFTSQDAGTFAGNLDFPLLQAGTKIEIPVAIPGAYIFVGDAHAIQFGGEITGAAVEIPAEVIFSVKLNKKNPLQWPRGETKDTLFALGTDLPFETAVQHALSGLIRYTEQRFALSHADAAALVGQVGDVQVCNVVSKTYTAVAVIHKSDLTGWL